MTWLSLLATGFLVGGIAGALAAGVVSGSFLRWTYVCYLTALAALVIFRPPHRRTEDTFRNFAGQIHWTAMLAVGVLAGFSSGFMGIGGGLAITAGLSGWLRVPQHQAQLVSLVLSIIPTTIPAAWVYWHQGWSTSWLTLCGVILGLWVGTDFGARMANRLIETKIRHVLLGFVTVMTVYMAYKALT